MRLAAHLNIFSALRKISDSEYPNPLLGATGLDYAGIEGIVCKYNDDQSEFTEKDFDLIRQVVKSHLCIESVLNESQLRKIMEIKPDQVTLIPENQAKNSGLDLVENSSELKEIISSLHAADIEASVLINPEIAIVKEARKVGANFVTLNTLEYANSKSKTDLVEKLEEIETTAIGADRLGLRVLATGGLNHMNIGALAALGTIEEVVLKNDFYFRSMLIGMEKAVRELREVIKRNER